MVEMKLNFECCHCKTCFNLTKFILHRSSCLSSVQKKKAIIKSLVRVKTKNQPQPKPRDHHNLVKESENVPSDKLKYYFSVDDILVPSKNESARPKIGGTKKHLNFQCKIDLIDPMKPATEKSSAPAMMGGRNLFKPMVFEQKLTDSELLKYGYVTKGRKIEISDERLRREAQIEAEKIKARQAAKKANSIPQRKRGRPNSDYSKCRSQSKKLKKDAPKPKPKPVDPVSRFRSARLLRGEEYTIFKDSQPDCITLIHSDSKNLPSSLVLEEEDDFDPYEDDPINMEEFMKFSKLLDACREDFEKECEIRRAKLSPVSSPVKLPNHSQSSSVQEDNDLSEVESTSSSGSTCRKIVKCPYCTFTGSLKKYNQHFKKDHQNRVYIRPAIS